ncbi:hypothetical protein [Halocatena pleomorpha]|uniref:Uncharacterized protein n=1 Tax=Halocatena pleomorpha TaxID=1785090 RepID=A0A3P3RF80_9EURY|nr:hypothetical protein [Halocatena pleomorpha]RRJ32177.1 hypothetical protein EIK79_05265 [Halocatena pleomorpha]
MAAVTRSEANAYGFRLIRSLLFTVFGGGSMIALGSLWFSLGIQGSVSVLLIGVVTVVLGVCVILSGVSGLFYKIIADGVKRGIERANESEE